MSLTLTGTIERQEIGLGTWVLKETSGATYELKNPPDELRQADLRVKVEGRVREDVMTIAMVGPVLEIDRFEIIIA